jgi:hypothetical protein
MFAQPCAFGFCLCRAAVDLDSIPASSQDRGLLHECSRKRFVLPLSVYERASSRAALLVRADSAPLTVKFFINNDSMDFGDAEDGKPVQEVELTAEELTEGAVSKLNFVKFQYVDHMTIFVADNNGDEVTTISGLHFYGTTIDGTDVSAIKKC